MNLLHKIKLTLKIIACLFFIPFAAYLIFVQYIEYLVKNNSKAAIIQIVNSFNKETLFSFVVCLIASSIFFLVPLYIAHKYKENIKHYKIISSILKRFTVASFIILFSSFGLTESQFAFFSALTSFIILIITSIFKN